VYITGANKLYYVCVTDSMLWLSVQMPRVTVLHILLGWSYYKVISLFCVTVARLKSEAALEVYEHVIRIR